MLMNLFIFWILASVFFGSRSANHAVSVIFGVIAVCWIIKMLLGFGLALLPYILVVLLFSKVIIPFVGTFLRHFR